MLTGVVSKASSEPMSIDLPLQMSSAGLRESVAPYKFALAVTFDQVGAATLPVQLYVSALPVAGQCTVELSGNSSSSSFIAAQTRQHESFTFKFVARDIDVRFRQRMPLAPWLS